MTSHLILLHGALGASDQFDALAPQLAAAFHVHRLDFEGHGRLPRPARPFDMRHFMENLLAYLDEHHLTQVYCFGYSMGGFVALLLALSHPERVAGVVTLGTKLHWDPAVAARETSFLNPANMQAKVPQFVQALAQRHTGAGWEEVVHQTRAMLLALGTGGGLTPADAARMTPRVRVMLGDRDRTVTLEESLAFYQALPQGELEIVPGAPHPLERVPVARLAFGLQEFAASSR